MRHIVISSMEIPRARGARRLSSCTRSEEFGVDELRRAGPLVSELRPSSLVRAVQALGVTKAVVPETFPLWLADRLRADGVELTPDREFFDGRRRVKSGAELAGHPPRAGGGRGRDGRRARPAAARRAERRRRSSSTASR